MAGDSASFEVGPGRVWMAPERPGAAAVARARQLVEGLDRELADDGRHRWSVPSIAALAQAWAGLAVAESAIAAAMVAECAAFPMRVVESGPDGATVEIVAPADLAPTWWTIPETVMVEHEGLERWMAETFPGESVEVVQARSGSLPDSFDVLVRRRAG